MPQTAPNSRCHIPTRRWLLVDTSPKHGLLVATFWHRGHRLFGWSPARGHETGRDWTSRSWHWKDFRMSPKKCLTSLNSCVFIFDSKLKVQCLSSVLSPKIKDPWLGITYKFARLHQEKKWFARQGEISLKRRRNISFSINTSNFLGDGDLSGTRCPSLCHFFYAFSRPAMSVSHVSCRRILKKSWELGAVSAMSLSGLHFLLRLCILIRSCCSCACSNGVPWCSGEWGGVWLSGLLFLCLCVQDWQNPVFLSVFVVNKSSEGGI